MPGAALSLQQLNVQVEQVRQYEPDARVIGICTPDGWRDAGELVVAGQRHRIIRADTVLEVREALQSAEEQDEPVVLLTRLPAEDLGADVVARLARSKLFHVDAWAIVCQLFKAKQLDPSVRERFIAQALLDSVPPEGYPPVPAGVLDVGTIWRTVFHHAFGMDKREPDLVGLLVWAAFNPGVERYRGASQNIRDAARSRLAATLGLVAETILNFVDSGSAQDAVALAIACGVVFSDGSEEPELRAAAARLERFHLNQPIPPETGRHLARVGHDAVEELARAHGLAHVQPHLLRADELLAGIQAGRFAYRSCLTPRGLEQRYQRFAQALTTALGRLDPKTLAVCERLARQVGEHESAGRKPEQVERSRMAVRLLRWLHAPAPAAGSFAQLVCAYRDDIAFADWAREAVAGGDEVPDLSDAYRRLDQAVTARRAAINRTFAAALADWTASGSSSGGVLVVEEVLARVVVPAVAPGNRVLLVVLDGMSWPVCHELLADLRRHQPWMEMSLESGEVPMPVVATVPCVTELSRTSLLSGFLGRGSSDHEKRNIVAHAGLAAVCDRNSPPVLFHKGELTESSRGALTTEVRKTVLSEKHRVVGVVVNAVDDRLSGAQQVRDTWTVEKIRPLGALFQAAREASRVVILASDHGHVWHREGPSIKYPAGGARWRPAEGGAHEGEVLIQGLRVRGHADQTRVIVPWEEGLRYGDKRNGYHGGATPQEMLAPLVLLVYQGNPAQKLYPCEMAWPAWWPETPAAPRSPARPAPAPRSRPSDRPLLPLEPDEAQKSDSGPARGAWLDRLPKAPVYKAQKQMAQRHAPEDAKVVSCLRELEAQGGAMTVAAFTHRLGILPLRLDGLIAKLQRLLNVDGYEVLVFDRERDLVALDVPLLKRQFELD